MKTASSVQQNKGSVLLVTLAITGILGLALASYLTLIGAQSQSVARSQNWNSSIPISEAGVEEAIVHLNRNCLWSDVTRSPVNWNADGWEGTADGNGVTKTRHIGSNYYEVTIITNAPYSTNGPGIFSKGFVPAFAQGSADTMFAAVGATTANQSSGFVGRQVRVTTGKDGFMTRAMVAKNSIDLNGNNIQTDSFDSGDPAYSTDGLYDPAKSKANGDVAVNQGVVNTLSIGNADIYGSVAVGPNGSISIGSNGKVGDAAWMADSTKTGIQPGHSRDDMNVSFPDVNYTSPSGVYPLINLRVTNDVITVTNISTISSSYPTGAGTVYTNTAAQITTSYPVAGTYIGSVITNITSATSGSYPSSGTYAGVVATNTTTTTSTSYPSAGSYAGSVITNIQTFTTDGYPSDPYGTVTTNYNGGGNKIRNYTYKKITGYTYEKLSGYSFNKITGYTVAHITGYTLVERFYTTNQVAETYDYVLDSGEYSTSSLSGKILVRGNATLYVSGDVSLTGSTDIIQINPSASLKLYMAGSSFSIKGQGVANLSGKAENFWYFGLPSNTDLSFGGNADFTGVIYAPQADFHLGGSGSSTEVDFVGATVTKTVQMNGHFNFHYDEALSRTGPSRGYIISGWDEIKVSDNYTP